jgi:hypothetical protein
MPALMVFHLLFFFFVHVVGYLCLFETISN